MDLDLSTEQELIRKTARDFAEREIAPYAADYDRKEEFPRAVLEKMKPLGFLGAPIPQEYGGMGVDAVSYALIIEEIARADSSVRSIISVNCSLVGLTILKWGTEEQKQAWLPKIASGETLGCFGLTEPGSGSDAASLQTRARRDGDDWVLDGTKMFITNGTVAGVALIMAQTDPSLGPKGIAAFLVPTDTPGFSANEIHGKLGLRASSTAELVLQDVRVRPDSMLGEIGDGMKVALSALDNGRVGLGASCVGLAQACLDSALAYAKERKQFGKPIAAFQLVQEMLAEMHVEIEAARLLVWRAASLKDKGVRNTLEASVAKFYASEAAVKCANLAIQVHGGYGYIDEYPVGRYLRDARVTTLYEGTSQIQKLLIGRHLTGENAFVCCATTCIHIPTSPTARSSRSRWCGSRQRQALMV
jgi:alkylation response protein AidB-like acyl-CoA dehydrogenase